MLSSRVIPSAVSGVGLAPAVPVAEVEAKAERGMIVRWLSAANLGTRIALAADVNRRRNVASRVFGGGAGGADAEATPLPSPRVAPESLPVAGKPTESA